MNITKDTRLCEFVDVGILNVHTTRILQTIGVKSVLDFVNAYKKDRFQTNIRGAGRITWKQIHDLVKLLLEQKPEFFELRTTNMGDIDALYALESSYRKITTGSEKVDEYLKSVYKYPSDLEYLLSTNYTNALVVVPTLTRHENILFRQYHIDLLKQIYSIILDHSLVLADVQDNEYLTTYISNLTQECTRFSLYEISHYFLTDEQRNYIENKFKILCKAKLTTYQITYMKKHDISFDDLVSLFDSSLSAYIDIFSCIQKTNSIEAIYDFNQYFKLYFIKLLYDLDLL